MTELKIKQADINNNGNQILMGDYWGRGETQNMYHIWMWVCTCVEERGEGDYSWCFGAELKDVMAKLKK